jgi:hypothetical protein
MNRVGVAHARCNENPNQIFSMNDLIEAGQHIAIDPTAMASTDVACNHGSYVYRTTVAGTTIPSKLPPSAPSGSPR